MYFLNCMKGAADIRRLQVKRILRNKAVYSCAVAGAIILGLCSRAYSDYLPRFAASHLGDALWAAMVYFGFRLLLTRHQLCFSLLLAFGFSFVIEFSQLYQAIWINEVRATVLGGLILGKGFLWVDLIRYSAGISIAYALDRWYLSRILRQSVTD